MLLHRLYVGHDTLVIGDNLVPYYSNQCEMKRQTKQFSSYRIGLHSPISEINRYLLHYLTPLNT